MRAAVRSLLAVVALSAVAHAQPVQQASNTRHPINAADIKAWNAMRGATLSNDGKWFAYVVGPAEGDATLIVKSTTDATIVNSQYSDAVSRQMIGQNEERTMAGDRLVAIL